MSDLASSAPLQRALRLEEMVIAAAAGSRVEEASSHLVPIQDPPADTEATLNTDQRDANPDGSKPAADIQPDANIAAAPNADAPDSTAPTLQASLQAIHDSLDPSGSPADSGAAASTTPQNPQPVHVIGTQIMPVGDIAHNAPILEPNAATLLDAQEQSAPLAPVHLGDTPFLAGPLNDPFGGLQAPLPPADPGVTQVTSTLAPVLETVGHAGGLGGDILAVVPSLQGAGVDALAGLLGPNPATSVATDLGGDVHAIFDHAVLSVPIGLDDLHHLDTATTHGLHVSVPLAGSGLI